MEDKDRMYNYENSFSFGCVPALTEEDVQKKITYTVRNYVRKERYNEFETSMIKTIIQMADRIDFLERKLNEVYYPMGR